MNNLPNIAARMFDRPMLIDPSYARFAYSFIGSKIGASELLSSDGQTIKNLETFAGSFQNRQRRVNQSTGQVKPYAMYDGGVAVIDIEGTLVHKNGYLDSSSGMQGYDGIAAKLDAAANDPDVKSVLLDCNSPGGEVSGCAELGQKIADFAKPIRSIANDQMTSAMYWIASQTDKIYGTSTSRIGSIGVLTAHQDYSRAVENAGVKITLIHSGDHKVDGNPYAALPPEVQSRIQAEIDGIRKEFADTVALGRGSKMSASEAMATEAKVYSAKDAKKIGLIDAVSNFDAVVKEMGQTGNGSAARKTPLNSKGKSMADVNETTYTAQEMTVAVAEASAIAVANAKDLATSELNTSVATAKAVGATDERERIKAIFASDESKGRTSLANHIAFNTSMSVVDAVGMLAASSQSIEAQAGAQTSELLRNLATAANVQATAATATSDLGGTTANASELTKAESLAAIKSLSKYAEKK